MKTRSHYWQLLSYLRPQRVTIGQALACTVGFVAVWPLLAWLAGRIAAYVGQGNVDAIAQVAGIAALIFLGQKLAQYGQDTLMAKAALSITLDLRKNVYAHLQTLSLDYFETTRTGDLSYRLTEDIDRIGEVVNKFFHQFLPSVLQLIAVFAYVVYLNWQLTLGIVLIAPLMGLLIGWFGERMRQFSRRSQNRVSDLSALLIEVFSGIRLVQAFAAEDYTLERFSQEAEHNRNAKYAAERLKAIQFPVVGFLEAMCLLLVFLLGGWQIAQGNLTGSEFVSYGAAVAMLIDPIAIVTSNYNEFKQGEASVDRIFELFAIVPTVIEKEGAMTLPPVTGKVEYRQISFAYTQAQENLERAGFEETLSSIAKDQDAPWHVSTIKTPWVLKDLSFLAQPGDAIALVGASGAGKTTLVNLLPRFYDPQAGEILIDGINIRDVTLKSLRRQIGIVPQETTLFSGTIAQNIAFGQKDFDLEAVQDAAKIANAHQFIIQFSQGYHTWVGERGINLSGGQRQRLAIARAVLLNPSILILDEATSALDSESEALVQEALDRIMKERTVFIIAHRLTTVRRADRILVMEQGQIIESGTHAELLEREGRYARFYAQQFT
ncbi:MAG: ABC transporter ATP-binding protein [Coleofasciculus sp. D1-CHI-01]|uniref:ABC transporter ATP-binding protein n=1 Tax=Coleofasciculus sp. D1-CHI-01 TaxID=3068482 RepID=UPI0032F86F95